MKKKKYSLNSFSIALCSCTATRTGSFRHSKYHERCKNDCLKTAVLFGHANKISVVQETGSRRWDSFFFCCGKAPLQGMMEYATPEIIYPCLPQTFPFFLPMELAAGENDKIQTCKCPIATSNHMLEHQCSWTVLSLLTAAANQRQGSALDESPWSSLSRNHCFTLEK